MNNMTEFYRMSFIRDIQITIIICSALFLFWAIYWIVNAVKEKNKTSGATIDFNAWLASCYKMHVFEDRYGRYGNFICLIYQDDNEKKAIELSEGLVDCDSESEKAFMEAIKLRRVNSIFLSGGYTATEAVEKATKQIREYYDKEIIGDNKDDK